MIKLNIRKSTKRGRKRFWVIDVHPYNDTSDLPLSYIGKDGTRGDYMDYSTIEDANVAAAMFWSKQTQEEIASTKPSTCGDCIFFSNTAGGSGCEIVGYGTKANNNPCDRFKPKNSAEKTKESNPKYDAGIKKAPLHCIPCGPIFELGLAMFEGSRKYGRHNYRDVGVRASVYYDASMGHIIDWWEGEDIDPDSGVHHLIKAMACLLVVRDSQLMGNFNDDRPLKYSGGLVGRSGLDKEVAAIVKKYPDCAKPFLETNKKESGRNKRCGRIM